MEIVNPSHTILDNVDGEQILLKLERCGRTAYKSEDRITAGSAEKFIAGILRRGHESVIEHVSISVRFVCDRGVTHEIVRHRLCAYTQESTRYCNYAKKGVTFVEPPFWEHGSQEYNRWYITMQNAEAAYNKLIEYGCTPQQARSVLPNSLKTEIVVTANLREWRHIMKLRTSEAAHPQMRELMIPLLADFTRLLPTIFGDIEASQMV